MIRRAWPALYWLAFAALAFDAARDPGFVPDPEHQPYPWGDVAIVLCVLALLTAWLRVVWTPRPARPRWVRAANAGVFVLVMLFLVQGLAYTDMSGLTYVPAFFALATLLLLVGRGVAQAIRAARRRGRTARPAA